MEKGGRGMEGGPGRMKGKKEGEKGGWSQERKKRKERDHDWIHVLSQKRGHSVLSLVLEGVQGDHVLCIVQQTSIHQCTWHRRAVATKQGGGCKNKEDHTKKNTRKRRTATRGQQSSNSTKRRKQKKGKHKKKKEA